MRVGIKCVFGEGEKGTSHLPEHNACCGTLEYLIDKGRGT